MASFVCREGQNQALAGTSETPGLKAYEQDVRHA
jgi:hypothetical protein